MHELVFVKRTTRDVVLRLRDHSTPCTDVDREFGDLCMRCEAADEIERLRAVVAGAGL